jgi:SsrA-binding protein
MAEKKKAPKKIEIKNRRAAFEYHFEQEFEAGIVLTGTEIKSIRAGEVNLSDAYCLIENGDMTIRSLYIAEYSHGAGMNHETRRPRRLLLRKPELRKLEKRVKERGMTIIPYKLYMTERGFAKVQICLATGKKSYDKRESIKAGDNKRDLDRMKKGDRD